MDRKLLQDIKINLNIEEVNNKLITYQHVIKEHNDKFNLISHNDLNKIEIRHFYDSLIPICICEEFFNAGIVNNNIINSIDIGSGAGFPGVPLAIALKNMELTIVEANRG